MVQQGSTYVNVVDVPQLALSFVYVVSWLTILASFQMLSDGVAKFHSLSFKSEVFFFMSYFISN